MHGEAGFVPEEVQQNNQAEVSEVSSEVLSFEMAEAMKKEMVESLSRSYPRKELSEKSFLDLFNLYKEDADRNFEAAQAALYDPPTRKYGVLNKNGFSELASKALIKEAEKPVERKTGSGALLFIDMNNMKKMNDDLGYIAVDNLMEEFAKRLRGEKRTHDVVSRFGGDEFVILMPGANPEEVGCSFMRRMIKSLDQTPISITTDSAKETKDVKPSFVLGVVPINSDQIKGFSGDEEFKQYLNELVIRAGQLEQKAKEVSRVSEGSRESNNTVAAWLNGEGKEMIRKADQVFRNERK